MKTKEEIESKAKSYAGGTDETEEIERAYLGFLAGADLINQQSEAMALDYGEFISNNQFKFDMVYKKWHTDFIKSFQNKFFTTKELYSLFQNDKGK